MEQEFVHWLRQRARSSSAVSVGIGDDAAVLQTPKDGQIVVTTDMLMDGVDFELHRCDPRRVGRKALAVNLSDLAAMASRPLAAFVSVALPRQNGLSLAKELYEGMSALADEMEISLAGGDTNSWDNPLVISVTAIGTAAERGPLLRSGARAGDAILVTGSFGGSILGRHFDFTPRVREALLLHQTYRLHAGIDVSDGLSLDLSRLARESGCGAALDLAAIPISPDAQLLASQQADAMSALDHALGDGEDFELILAVSPDEAERILADQPLAVPIRRIGEFVPSQGLWSRSRHGDLQAMTPRGFEHPLN